MSTTGLPARFAARVRQLRESAGLSQEALATRSGLHRTHVSLIETGKRLARLDTVGQLAVALGVEVAELFVAPIRPPTVSVPLPTTDREEFERLWPAIREYQVLADRHRISDIFQDNGGKLLQTLIVLDLENIPGREGNDARDKQGNEYELKTVNAKLTKSFSTHHHLNLVILAKYRAVAAWYFSVYEHIELVKIYRLTPVQLEPYFLKWEEQWKATKRDINNPKIPLRFVESHGLLVYERP